MLKSHNIVAILLAVFKQNRQGRGSSRGEFFLGKILSHFLPLLWYNEDLFLC